MISSRSPTGCAETKPLARGIAPRTGCGDGEIVARRSDAPHDLPVGFRGYDRASTDELIAWYDERSAALTRERDDLSRQVSDLKRDVEDYFPAPTHRMILTEPLRITNTAETYDVDATIIYRVEDEEVVILHVFHGRQDIDSLLGR